MPVRKLSIVAGFLLLTLAAASPALAQDNIATSLLGKFVSQTDGWWGILRGYALFLFTTTLIVEVCLFGVRVALQQTNIAEIIGQFVTLLLFAGFIAAVIMNYQDWATGVAVKGLRPLTGELTGNSVDAGMPLAMAAAVVDKILPVMGDAGITDFGAVYLYVSCMLIVLIIFVLISALVILVTCEFYIIANIGILLIGLGGSKIFKDYAINVMRYILAVACKLFVLQLIVNIGFAIISLSDLDAAVGSTVKSIKFVDLFYLIGKAIILLALAKSLPDTCAGIINGSAINGGNPLASMAQTAGTMAVGAVSGGAGYVAGMAQAATAAHAIAKDEGATGVVGTAGGMVKAAWQARRDAKAGETQQNLDKHPESIRNQLVSRANAITAQRMLDNMVSPSGGEAGSSDQGSLSLSPGPLSSPVSSAAPAGGAGHAESLTVTTVTAASVAPTSETPNAPGQPAPSAGNSGDSSSVTSQPQSTAGGSGTPPPKAVTSPEPVEQPVQETAGKPVAPKAPVDYTPKKTKGTVDMTKFDPSTLKK